MKAAGAHFTASEAKDQCQGCVFERERMTECRAAEIEAKRLDLPMCEDRAPVARATSISRLNQTRANCGSPLRMTMNNEDLQRELAARDAKIAELKKCIASYQSSLKAHALHQDALIVDPAQRAPIQSGEVAELRRLAEAATPGPWDFDTADEPYRIAGGEVVGGDALPWGCVYTVSEYETPEGSEQLSVVSEIGKQDGRYIAAANPAAILGLLDALDAATAAQPIADVSARHLPTSVSVRMYDELASALEASEDELNALKSARVSAPTDEPIREGLLPLPKGKMLSGMDLENLLVLFTIGQMQDYAHQHMVAMAHAGKPELDKALAHIAKLEAAARTAAPVSGPSDA